MAKDTVERLIALLEPMATDHGLELVTVEVLGQGKATVVRVYLDHEEGITIDRIMAANVWVSDALDQADLVSSSYTLEVSSPGIERPLRKRSDWERFSGQDVTVKTVQAIDGRKTFTGRINGLEGDDVLIETDDVTFHVPLDAVRKANLKVDFGSIEEGKTR